MVGIKYFGLPECCLNCNMFRDDYCVITETSEEESGIDIYAERMKDCPLVSFDEMIEHMEGEAAKQLDLALHINDIKERAKHLYAEERCRVVIQMLKKLIE